MLATEGSHNGSAAVLKTAGRKAMQVRVLSPPPFPFNNLPPVIDHIPSVPVATWRDLGALLETCDSRVMRSGPSAVADGSDDPRVMRSVPSAVADGSDDPTSLVRLNALPCLCSSVQANPPPFADSPASRACTEKSSAKWYDPAMT